jgi:hypothetical protein
MKAGIRNIVEWLRCLRLPQQPQTRLIASLERKQQVCMLTRDFTSTHAHARREPGDELRAYKKNLQFLAKFSVGTGGLFSGYTPHCRLFMAVVDTTLDFAASI